MRADYQSFRRAAGVCVLGLILQTMFAAATLIFAVYAKTHAPTANAATTAAIFMAIGILVWLAMLIVFDQHRRERIEAMEADALAASDTAASSVFKGDEDDSFRVAARRLAAMYKWFLPAVSILIAGLLLGAGILRFKPALAYSSGGASNPLPEHLRGWLLALGLGLAVVGFIFARYASGMAKQKMWKGLRAGAGSAVGSALFGLAMAAAAFVDIAGPDTVLRALPASFAVSLVVLGVEVVVNFLLYIYRPRKPGETPSPAFDSWILGFVATPDRIAKTVSDAITYQLGFDVTSTWFYRLFTRSFALLVAVGVGVVWLLSMMTVIQPHQRGLVLRFGEVIREVGPGLHFKLPFPIETIEVPRYDLRDATGRITGSIRTTTGLRELDAGSPAPTGDSPILWTNEHTMEEVFQIVQPASSAGSDSRASPQGIALLAMEVKLLYTIDNVTDFDRLAPPEQRDDLLRAIAKREVTQHLGRTRLEDVLGEGRLRIAEELRQRISDAYTKLNPGADGSAGGAGVEVVWVGLNGVHPPKQVATNFERVVDAERKREAKIQAAQEVRIRRLTEVVGSVDLASRIVSEIRTLEAMRTTDSRPNPEQVVSQELKIQDLMEQAGGKAAAMISESKALRWAAHLGERSRAEQYRGQLAQYTASPRLYAADMYFNTLSEAMRRSRVYITRGEQMRVIFDVKSTDLNANYFDAGNQSPQN